MAEMCDQQVSANDGGMCSSQLAAQALLSMMNENELSF
jgi:hypothetical protein